MIIEKPQLALGGQSRYVRKKRPKVLFDGRYRGQDVIFEIFSLWLFAIISSIAAPILKRTIVMPDCANVLIVFYGGISVLVSVELSGRGERYEICLNIVNSSIKDYGRTPIWICSFLQKSNELLIALGLIDVLLRIAQRDLLLSNVDKFGIRDHAVTVRNDMEIKLNSGVSAEHLALNVIDAITNVTRKIVNYGPDGYGGTFISDKNFGYLGNAFKSVGQFLRRSVRASKGCHNENHISTVPDRRDIGQKT